MDIPLLRQALMALRASCSDQRARIHFPKFECEQRSLIPQAKCRDRWPDGYAQKVRAALREAGRMACMPDVSS